MKVLFAVSNENISDSIVKKYQKDYKEIISYKNVYYFNAILKELQRDKTYDRIVISEDLEPFANNDYEAIDRFIFDKLDSISDEATDSEGGDTPIILICSDRRTKAEQLLVKLFSIGIYSAILGQDRSIDQVCELIKKPRTKKEAKGYYKIESDDAKYQEESEDTVSELEIQNIRAHYKKLGKNEDAYVESFDNIAAQYSDSQLKLIIKFLPINVKAVLEANSPKYQSLMAFSGNNNTIQSKPIKKQEEKEDALKIDFIENQLNKQKLTRPVIVPSAVNTKKVTKLNKSVTATPIQLNEEIEEINNIDEEVSVEESNPIVQPVKRGRGRPKKVVEEDVQLIKEVATPKRGRGRPKKVTKVETQEEIPDLLPGLNDYDKTTSTIQTRTENTGILPGFEEDDEQEENEATLLPGFEPIEEETNTLNEPSNNYSNYNSSQYSNYSNEIINQESNTNVNLESLLTKDKKVVSFVGTSKNGTSFLINNLAELFSSMGIKTAILDMTQNKNAYYIYTKNEEELRRTAYSCMENLEKGMASGIEVNKNLTVYTSLPIEGKQPNATKILSTLIKSYSLVLIDCDFNTPIEYYENSQEIYLVQSMDVLTIQPLTAFLRDLKARNVLRQENIRIVINKETKTRTLNPKVIIGGMAYYNDPAMSFMTELFNKDSVKNCTIPFDAQVYSKYLEELVNCKISLNGYSKNFIAALKNLGNMVYPLLSNKYRAVENYSDKNAFSKKMDNTLEQMKRNY